jgi:hypothetical protein
MPGLPESRRRASGARRLDRRVKLGNDTRAGAFSLPISPIGDRARSERSLHVGEPHPEMRERRSRRHERVARRCCPTPPAPGGCAPRPCARARSRPTARPPRSFSFCATCPKRPEASGAAFNGHAQKRSDRAFTSSLSCRTISLVLRMSGSLRATPMVDAIERSRALSSR